jgi:hypothetical protein
MPNPRCARWRAPKRRVQSPPPPAPASGRRSTAGAARSRDCCNLCHRHVSNHGKSRCLHWRQTVTSCRDVLDGLGRMQTKNDLRCKDRWNCFGSAGMNFSTSPTPNGASMIVSGRSQSLPSAQTVTDLLPSSERYIDRISLPHTYCPTWCSNRSGEKICAPFSPPDNGCYSQSHLRRQRKSLHDLRRRQRSLARRGR